MYFKHIVQEPNVRGFFNPISQRTLKAIKILNLFLPLYFPPTQWYAEFFYLVDLELVRFFTLWNLANVTNQGSFLFLRAGSSVYRGFNPTAAPEPFSSTLNFSPSRPLPEEIHPPLSGFMDSFLPSLPTLCLSTSTCGPTVLLTRHAQQRRTSLAKAGTIFGRIGER